MKRRFKKIISLLTIPILLISMVLNSSILKEVKAADLNNKVQLTNLRLLSTLDDNVLPGNIMHGKDQTEANVNFAGEYSFNEAPGVIRNGDSFSVDVPSPLKLEDAELPLVDTNSNETLGKAVASSATGKITFTFNEKVEDKHHIHGTFKVSAKQTVTNEDKTIVYTLPGGKTQSITYKVLKATNQNVKGETVYKAGYDGGNMNYWVRVNRSKKDLSGKVVKIKDFFDTSKGSLATYIEKSFSLKEAVYTEESTYEKDLVSTGKVYKVTTDASVYKADPDNTALLTFTNSKTGFDLLLPTNTGTKSFLLEYSSTSPQDSTKLYNSVGMEIDNEAQPTWTEWAGKKNTETTHVKDLKSTKAIGATITADLAGKVKILKYDEGDASVVLSGVQFDIKKENGELVETITTNEKGIAVSGLLPDGKYIAKEKVAKDGYKLNEKEYPFEIDSAKEKANKKNTSTLNIPNKRKTIDFEVTKVWKNGVSSDYKQVKLGLYVHKEGEDASNAKPVTGSYTPTVTSANGVYTYRWTDQLPERNLDGSKLVYSVRELQEKTDLPLETGDKVTVGERNYVVSYNDAKTEVINTYEVPKTKITANKIWEGGQSEVRPTLFFKLYRSINGVEEEVKVDNKEVPKINGSVEWTDLPKTTEAGSEYTYSVKEVDDRGNLLTEKTAGYSVEKTDNLTIKNKYSVNPLNIDIAVSKELSGNRLEKLKQDEFEFILKSEDGREIQKVRNSENGEIVFRNVNFTEKGTYNFVIVEVNGGKTINGVRYDNKEINVTVKVTDDGRGNLTSEISYPNNEKRFINEYIPAEKTSVTLGAKKVLEGKTLEEGKYSFELKDEKDKVLQTVTNKADGTISFAGIEYDESQVGTHKYKISEVAGNEPGVTYDKTVYEVEVSVTKDTQTNRLNATVSKTPEELKFTNQYTPAEKTSVTLGAKKVLEGKTLEEGKYSFELKDEKDKVLQTVTNKADGTISFAGIEYDESQVGTHKYKISEVAGNEPGVTYDKTVYEVEVSVTKDTQTNRLNATVSKTPEELKFTNTFVQKLIDIPVTKVWNDNNNNDGKRPNNVEVELLENGSSTGKKLILSSENNWKGSFQNLVAEKDGKAINYSVVEVATNGYQASVTGDVNTGYTITNSYSNETVNIKAVKNWDDGNNQDGKRPSEIKINLLADGEKVETKTVKADQSGKWEVSFTGKPKYKDGKEIKYTITEEAVNEYTTTITDFNVVNKYVPKVVEFQVTKIWDDANNQDGKRPSTIQVQLYKSIEGSVETPLPDKILTLEEKGQNNPNKWTGIFTNLPKYENGKEVSYSVKEINVPEGYVSNVVGKEITNSHTPEEIVIEGTKVWNDNNNQDGKRSKIIRVQILNGEKVVDEIEVSEKTNWTFKSKSLPKYENGKEIKYAVKEMEVKTYSTDISKDDNGKYTITNTHEPEKISLQGQKIWDDMNNIDQIRPVSITVKLYANGEDTGKTATVTENNGWRYEFSNLDKYKDGKLITYSVKEVNIPNGYEVEENGMNIINHHKPNKPKDPEPNKPKDPEPNKPKDPEPNKPKDPEPNKPKDPEPNKPKDPEPNKPKDPEPNKPKNPEPKTINPDKSRELDNNKKLPLTGSESGNSLLGLILLGVGTSLVAYKRRKED